jgi:hypothetical protein
MNSAVVAAAMALITVAFVLAMTDRINKLKKAWDAPGKRSDLVHSIAIQERCSV